MKTSVVVFGLVIVTLIGSVLAFGSRGTSIRSAVKRTLSDSPAASVKGQATPVLVELFTSEGCSSCPPADALLAKLAKSGAISGAQIIPLEEHVDYWNHLGWTDPYSASRFTARQRSYVQLMHLDQVYTPQMVVDGRRELLGSDESAARSAIADTRASVKAGASVSIGDVLDNAVTLKVHIDPIPSLRDDEKTDVIAAVTEDNLESNVTRGENSGSRLRHVGVVRNWQIIGHGGRINPFTGTANITLESSWKKAELHAVVFEQGHDSGQIYAVASVKIEASKNN